MTASRTLEPGAPPQADGVALCVPFMRGNEWRYIKECLDTNWVSSVGPFVNRFERDVAQAVGAKHAVAMATGTAALHLALITAGVRADDEVVTSSLSFIAPANAIRYVGAWPVFIDSEPRYAQMDAQAAVRFLRERCERAGGVLRNRATGRRVAAIMPVHVLGHPVDLDPILEVARELGLPVVEDATESLGAKYRGRAVGRLADIAAFSFNGNKMITTGGGGMLVTDRKEWADRCRHLSTQAKDDPLEYVHSEIGFNYRMTNVLAAMGCAQLEGLADCVKDKLRISARYNDAFRNVPGLIPMEAAEWASSVFWLYTMRVDPAKFGIDSRTLLRRLDAQGIQTRPLWQPLHRSRAMAGSPAMECPESDRWNAMALSLPCSVGLSAADQERVIAAVLAAPRS